MVDYTERFWYIKPSLYLWDEANVLMVIDFYDVFLDSVSSILLITFASMFMSVIGL